MRPGASESSKLRGLLDGLDALDGMDVVKVLSRRDRPAALWQSPVLVDRSHVSARYVVIPWGGSEVSVISPTTPG